MQLKTIFEFNDVAEAFEFMAHVNKFQRSSVEPRPFEHSVLTTSEVASQPVSALPGVTEETQPATKPRKARAAKVSLATGATAIAVDVAPPAAEKPITVDDLRGALKAVLAAKGAAATQSILETFKVARIGELQPAAYGQFVASCNEVVAAK